MSQLDRLHNILSAIPKMTIECIQGDLFSSNLVDVVLAFEADEAAREQVVSAMEMAGYKLRNDQLNTLTFLKEPE